MSDAPVKAEPRLCFMCGHRIPVATRKCKYCDSVKYEKQCKVCGNNLPFSATYCNECKSYQDWRRPFGASQAVLALLVALVTVSTPLVKALYEYVTRHSKTAIVFQSATADAITITAVNTGRSRSILRGYTLIPIEDGVLEPTELKIFSDDAKSVAVIPADDQVAIRLRPLAGMAASVPYEQISEQLRRKNLKMKLEVKVEESSGTETRSDEFLAKQIRVFILKQVPNTARREQK